MAKVIAAIKRPRYPWKRWSDGKARAVTRGVDFTCTTAGFRASIFNYAQRHKRRVETSINGDTVQFRFRPLRKKKSA